MFWEFKGCVREMGLYDLEPLLNYLANKEGKNYFAFIYL